MPYDQDIAPCLAGAVGGGGLDPAALDAALERCAPALEALRAARARGAPWLALPDRRDDLPALEERAAARRGAIDDAVLFGAGGASLGARTLCALAPAAARPRMRFLDNLDASGLAGTLASLDFARTLFLVVSKSGATAETLAQFLVAWDAVRAALGERAARDRFLVVCEPGDNPLRRLAARRGLETLDHDPDLGGRYSALSAVGLFPALIAGLDARAARAGAAEALRRALDAGAPRESPPALGAALQAAFAEARGARVSVMLAWADRLAPFAAWYNQLWAESLGKDGKGTTPVAALGPRDRHSQLQLWLDGPAHEFLTLVSVDGADAGPRVPPAAAAEEPGLAWLAGHRVGGVAAAMAEATADSLAAAGRPARRIRLAALDERGLGALLMHFMLETVIAGRLFGVDPFGQPAVERGKRLVRDRLAARAAGGGA